MYLDPNEVNLDQNLGSIYIKFHGNDIVNVRSINIPLKWNVNDNEKFFLKNFWLKILWSKLMADLFPYKQWDILKWHVVCDQKMFEV